MRKGVLGFGELYRFWFDQKYTILKLDIVSDKDKMESVTKMKNNGETEGGKEMHREKIGIKQTTLVVICENSANCSSTIYRLGFWGIQVVGGHGEMNCCWPVWEWWLVKVVVVSRPCVGKDLMLWNRFNDDIQMNWWLVLLVLINGDWCLGCCLVIMAKLWWLMIVSGYQYRIISERYYQQTRIGFDCQHHIIKCVTNPFHLLLPFLFFIAQINSILWLCRDPPPMKGSKVSLQALKQCTFKFTQAIQKCHRDAF